MSYSSLDPSTLIQFVKADDDLVTHISSTKSKKTEKLDGNEIADFYRSLISEPSTSKFEPEKPKPTEKRENPKPTRPISKPVSTSKVQPEPLTSRDHRLWFKAAAENDIKTVKEYHARGIDLEETDFFGATALICAAARGAADVIEYLLESGAVPSQEAVIMAEKKRHPEIAEYIVSFQSPKPSTPTESEPQTGTCNDCRLEFTDIAAHQCSIAHIVNSKEAPRPGYAYGIPMSNKGYKLLKDTGWNEGRGLGGEGTGLKYPLKTILKRDRHGLGSRKYPLKVTHFDAHDERAVHRGVIPRKPGKREYFKQLEERKKRDKRIDETIRHALRD